MGLRILTPVLSSGAILADVEVKYSELSTVNRRFSRKGLPESVRSKPVSSSLVLDDEAEEDDISTASFRAAVSRPKASANACIEQRRERDRDEVEGKR